MAKFTVITSGVAQRVVVDAERFYVEDGVLILEAKLAAANALGMSDSFQAVRAFAPGYWAEVIKGEIVP